MDDFAAQMALFEAEVGSLDATSEPAPVVADAPLKSPPSIQRPSGPPPAIQRPTLPPPSIQRPSGPPPAIQRPSGPPPPIQRPTLPPPSIQRPSGPPPSSGPPAGLSAPPFTMPPQLAPPPAFSYPPYPPPNFAQPAPSFPPPAMQYDYADAQLYTPAGPNHSEQGVQSAAQQHQQAVLSEALAGVKRALAQANAATEDEAKPKKKKAHFRTAAGEKWKDATLAEWPENDHRIFVGDLGNEVNDDVLSKAFVKYPSFAKAKVVKDTRTGKTKGYGFVSFLDPTDFAKAMREMDGKYIGNRPAKLRKSDWQKREMVGKASKGGLGRGGKSNKRHHNHF